MINVTRVKKTGKIVYEMGKAGPNHTYVLFPYGRTTKNGMKGNIQSVRNSNLITDRETLA